MWELLGSQQATNIFSLVLVAVTGIYVFLTYRIAISNSRMAQHIADQQEELSRPIIVANIEIRSQVLFVLVIRNAGRTVATDIHMSLDRDFYRFGKKEDEDNLRQLAIFQNRPFTLAPGDKLQFDLAQGFVLFSKNADQSVTPSVFKVELTYASSVKRYNDTIMVDLNPYRMTAWPKSEIALELEKLTKAVRG